MDRGVYASTALGLAQMKKLDLVNNNLANVNTPGFKKQILVGEAQSFDQTLAKLVENQDPYAKADHQRTPGVVSLRSVTDFTQGPIKSTGNTFDVALRDPKDFFVVNTPSGLQYTRAGDFSLNTEGEIVTMDGYQVQGDGGPIAVNGPNVRIAPNGQITVNKTPIGKLQVVRFDDPTQLERVGATRFKLGAGQAQPIPVDPNIATESLEMSNVSAISSMIDLISASRGFEMYSRTVASLDQLNQAAINQVGRSR